jgi:hypothetical protein
MKIRLAYPSATLIVVLSLLLILVGTAGIARASGSSANKGSRKAVPSASLFKNKILIVPFEVLNKGEICVVFDPNKIPGDPIEAYQKLYLVLPKQGTEISSLNDLKGKVKIRTAGEALAYCRLRTSPTTWYLWPNQCYLEIVPLDSLDLTFFFGNRDEYKYTKASYKDKTNRLNGFNGIVEPKSALSKFGIKPTTCTATKDGYEIHRTFIDNKQIGMGPYYSIAVTEQVGKDGSYSIQMGPKHKLREDMGVKWFIEWFM